MKKLKDILAYFILTTFVLVLIGSIIKVPTIGYILLTLLTTYSVIWSLWHLADRRHTKRLHKLYGKDKK